MHKYFITIAILLVCLSFMGCQLKELSRGSTGVEIESVDKQSEPEDTPQRKQNKEYYNY